MLLFYSLALYLSLTPSTTAAASPKETSLPEPCTARSPNTHAFFDLNPLHIAPPTPADSTEKPAKHERDYSWNTTGWGLDYNFTMNFCGPVVEPLDRVEGVDKALWGNVSAFYRRGDKIFSIGQQNAIPVFRGKKLVLNYTNGSPCDPDASKRADLTESLEEREIIGGDKDKDHDDDKKKPSKSHDGYDGDKPKKPVASSGRTKNTLISLLCASDPLAPQLALSFVGASPDECTYFFEARTPAGCAGIEVAKQTLQPAGVFGVIVTIAILVYVVGGCVYSRVVLQQRGWRQLPNYGLWAGLFGFFKVSSAPDENNTQCERVLTETCRTSSSS